MCIRDSLCRPDETEKMDRLIRSILGKTGKQVHVEPPFRCDYGFNIEVGENFYSNYNLTILDVGKVIIGDHTMFAPNVSIYTAEMCIRDRDYDVEMKKVMAAVGMGAEAIMDLSSHGDTTA